MASPKALSCFQAPSFVTALKRRSFQATCWA